MHNYTKPLYALLGATAALLTLSASHPAARPAGTQANETVSVWLTYPDKSKLLAQQSNFSFAADNGSTNPTTITVDEATTYQSIDGFGAAMTGSSAYLLNQKMNASQRDALLSDLFGSGGINISFLRHTIGASDFSLYDYTYNDVPQGQTDWGLNNFSINPDKADVVPMLQAALAKNPNLRIIGTPWSPPAWMKNDYTLKGSSLADDKYGVYADYFVKYVQAFANEGVPIYAVTLQNEPFTSSSYYPSSFMLAYQEGNFLKYHIGPKFANAGITTKLVVYDDAWEDPGYTQEAFSDATARQYAAGTAFHCYRGNAADGQNPVHDAFPDKGIWMTECSGGNWATDFGGNVRWNVSNLIIAPTRAWAKGSLLWNLALDQNSGPTNGGCTNCRGFVTIDNNTGNVTRNEEYYSFGHASKFVKQGAVRIASNSYSGGIEDVAFKNPDGSKVLIALNNGSSQTTFKVQWGNQAFSYTLPPSAVATFKWSGTQSGGSGGGGGGGIVSGHTYEIKGQQSQKVLDVPGSNLNNGIALQTYTANGSAAQQWTVTDVGSGYYKIVNVNSGKGLDVRDVRTDDAAPIQQYDYVGGYNQQWSIQADGSGYYNIVSRNSGKFVDVYAQNTGDGGQIVQYHDTDQDNQRWSFRDLGTGRAALAAVAPAAEELRLQVYPTVVDREIKFEYTAFKGQSLVCQVVDLTGRVVAGRPEVAVTAGLNRLTMPVAAVAPGVYVLKVSTPAGLLTRRVVVAR